MERDLVDFLLSEFHQRPGMYLGAYSLSKPPTLINGFMIASHFYDEKKTALKRFSDFIDWFEKQHSSERFSSWTIPFLEMANQDDKAALDLFFSELKFYVSQNSQS
jgi:hypothetical protein